MSKKRNITIVAALTAFMLVFAGVMIYHPPIEGNVDTYQFHFDKPTTSLVYSTLGIFTKVSIADWSNVGDVGKPELPAVDISFLIPDYRVIKSINVTYSNLTIRNLMFTILPVQHEINISESSPLYIVAPVFKRIPLTDYNKTYYKSNTYVYGKIYDVQPITFLRGFPLQTITLYPVDYHTCSKKLYFYQDIQITFTYENGTINNQYRRFTQEDIDYLKGVVANPDVLDTYKETTPPPEDEYSGGLCHKDKKVDYVIITNNRLKNSWAPLIGHRIVFSNLSADIVTTEEILACEDYWNSTPLFNDSVARIREFCKDAYLDWETEYVLIGGDWDSNPSHQIVPYRTMTLKKMKYAYNFMPSDVYYSNLDNTFWDI